MRAKQIYLASTPDIRGLHEKALLESTLFGLPMLSVNMPGTRDTTSGPGSIIGGDERVRRGPRCGARPPVRRTCRSRRPWTRTRVAMKNLGGRHGHGDVLQRHERGRDQPRRAGHPPRSSQCHRPRSSAPRRRLPRRLVHRPDRHPAHRGAGRSRQADLAASIAVSRPRSSSRCTWRRRTTSARSAADRRTFSSPRRNIAGRERPTVARRCADIRASTCACITAAYTGAAASRAHRR